MMPCGENEAVFGIVAPEPWVKAGDFSGFGNAGMHL